MIGYLVALGCAFERSRLIHLIAAGGLICLYIYYMKLKFAPTGGEGEGGELDPSSSTKPRRRPRIR